MRGDGWMARADPTDVPQVLLPVGGPWVFLSLSLSLSSPSPFFLFFFFGFLMEKNMNHLRFVFCFTPPPDALLQRLAVSGSFCFFLTNIRI